MEQEKREIPHSSEEANRQKAWETPILETSRVAEGIQNIVSLPAGDALVVGS